MQNATTLGITGWGVLSSLATGAVPFTTAVRAGSNGLTKVQGLFDEPLPEDEACVLPNFSARDYLGRKGTGYIDRTTALALVAAQLALEDSYLPLTDSLRDTTGVVLGGTAGSIRATSEYDRDTLTQDKPYLVNPMLFPTAVMNSAAARCAIWHRLRGANTTIPSGQLAGLHVLRYSRTMLARGHADALLVGTAEEFSPQMAWGHHHLYGAIPGRAPLGEGAVVTVAEDAHRARVAGRHLDAEVLAVKLAQYGPGTASSDLRHGLSTCIRAAVQEAGVTSSEIWASALAKRGIPHFDDIEEAALDSALGTRPLRLSIKHQVGEAHGAAGGFQMAHLLAWHRADPALDGQASVITSLSSSGAVGAAVMRGWSRAGEQHAS